MNLYILIHHHRHGIDVFPVEADDETQLPEPVDVIDANLSSLELGEDEYTEWRGPWALPLKAFSPSRGGCDR